MNFIRPPINSYGGVIFSEFVTQPPQTASFFLTTIFFSSEISEDRTENTSIVKLLEYNRPFNSCSAVRFYVQAPLLPTEKSIGIQV